MNIIATAISKVVTEITEAIQGRIERSKNERDKLQNEVNKLLNKKHFTAVDSYNVNKMENRMKELNTIINNNAKD